jgi:hypothetical protein
MISRSTSSNAKWSSAILVRSFIHPTITTSKCNAKKFAFKVFVGRRLHWGESVMTSIARDSAVSNKSAPDSRTKWSPALTVFNAKHTRDWASFTAGWTEVSGPAQTAKINCAAGAFKVKFPGDMGSICELMF